MSKTLMWFRKDLRLDDNTALNELMKQTSQKEERFCVFQLNPNQFIENSFNHAAFFQSLDQFVQTAQKNHVPIHFLYGEVEASFRVLKDAYPEWDTVYFNKDERGHGRQRDEKIHEFFLKQAITVQSYQDSHLLGVDEVTKSDGENYKVFTPYFKEWQKKKKRTYQKTGKITHAFCQLDHALFKEGHQRFRQLQKQATLPFDYKCGEEIAEQHLKNFVINNLHTYRDNRDYPFLDETSKLSRFLRTGELSIRKVWQAVIAEPDSDGRQTFITELCWRDFYNMIYAENPQQKNTEIKKQYQLLQWNKNKKQFEQWVKGETGYPIVDAAMKQLNQTGWMHNRLRMIVASFLTKDLRINWQWGEQYFQKQLIDYDPASNIGGWQWAASTGTDAVPYFRIFNPTKQSEKFDKQGQFIRHYLPVLKEVPSQYIHEPAKMTPLEQQTFHCIIGKDYPKPMVDHSRMRPEILTFFKEQIEQ